MFLRIILISGLLAWQSVCAVEVKGLFEAEAIAFSQEPEDRQAAIRDALTIVLQRVLVGEPILADPVVADILNRAASFVKKERLSFIENPYDANTQARRMHIEFDEVALLDSLKDSRLGIWNEIRPETLLWLTVEGKDGKQVFKPKAMPEMRDLVQKASREQGMPLRLPLWDAHEHRNITFAKLHDPGLESLLKISARYKVVSILSGHMIDRSWCWESKWVLLFGNAVKEWSGECGTQYETIIEGFRGAYQVLSRFYSAKPHSVESGELPMLD
ncbi:MAG: hypothetical protein Kow0065_19480 [Methylomicrobium sp.]